MEGLSVDGALAEAFRITLNDERLDPSFREVALTLPSETMIAENMDVIDPQAIHSARQFLRKSLAVALHADLLDIYHANQTPGDYRPTAADAAKRSLKNLALLYLNELDNVVSHALVQQQYDGANNMTDRLAALSGLVQSNALGRAAALTAFYNEFEEEALVVDKWFMLQGTAHTTDVDAALASMRHPAFTLKNPNRARSLLFSFCGGNASRFDAVDGSG